MTRDTVLAHLKHSRRVCDALMTMHKLHDIVSAVATLCQFGVSEQKFMAGDNGDGVCRAGEAAWQRIEDGFVQFRLVLKALVEQAHELFKGDLAAEAESRNQFWLGFARALVAVDRQDALTRYPLAEQAWLLWQAQNFSQEGGEDTAPEP